MLSGLLLSSFVSVSHGVRGSLDPVRPNILFIMSDDHALSAISIYDGTDHAAPPEGYIQTPNIDRIAKEGIRFDKAYVTNSLCGPSRAAMLTGKFSHRNGFYTNRFDAALNESQWTLPKELQKGGYWTALVGKYHLGDHPSGFDYWNILKGQGMYYKPQTIEMGTQRVYPGIHCTDWTTNVTIETLNRVPESTPFFLMMHHKAPHRNWMAQGRYLGHFGDRVWPTPPTFYDDYSGREAAQLQDMRVDGQFWSMDQKLFLPDDMPDPGTGGAKYMNITRRDQRVVYQEHIDRMTADEKAAWMAFYEPLSQKFFDRDQLPTGDDLAREFFQSYMRDYLQTVVGVDESVGLVMNHLESAGVLDNTLIVYTSDQGFYLGEHGWFDKRFMYETSFRTPLVMRFPPLISAGRTNRQMVMNLDFAATFLELVGLGDQTPPDVQGESFLPILTGEPKKFTRDSIYYHYYDNPSSHNVKRHYGVRTSNYKLMHFWAPEIDSWELYDLNVDPTELNNLYANSSYRGIRESMHASMDTTRKKYGDSCPPLCEDVSGPKICPGGSLEVCIGWCPSGSSVTACRAQCTDLCSGIAHLIV